VGEERERIDELEAAAVVNHDRIDRLEAAALLRDAQIAELVREVEGFQAAREHAAVINEAKGVLMSTMHIGPDAAFAVRSLPLSGRTSSSSRSRSGSRRLRTPRSQTRLERTFR
jgi:hypothetical protein